ncbi:MAG TPA: hypothetical protein PKA82_16480 [Pyrinomonadaceae bacterium]|nr:hypothetical protein [Pyrinomonadaceae bacterium]
MTLLAHHTAAGFWLERNGIVASAIVADYLITRRGIFALSGFL